MRTWTGPSCKPCRSRSRTATATSPRRPSSRSVPTGCSTRSRSRARSRPAACSSRPASIPRPAAPAPSRAPGQCCSRGALARPGDMRLEALVACAGVTLRSVATSMEIDVTGSVHAEGDLDFRGTLGVDGDAPVGFASIRLRFDLASDESEESLDKLLELTERYCVVFQTLAGGVPVELSYSTSSS